METTTVLWGYIGIMGKKMQTAVANWGNIGISCCVHHTCGPQSAKQDMLHKTERKKERSYWDNGKENGNYYSILGLCGI